jgi:hypothetical protein
MPAFLLKLMPWRGWGYAAIAAAAVIFYNVHVHNLIVAGQQHEIAAIKTASDKVQKAAEAEKAAMVADYAAKSAATEKMYVQNFAAAATADAADLLRLQQLASHYRDAYSALQSATGAGGKPDPSSGASGPGGVGELPQGLRVSLGLASALRADDNLLAECRADRDALSGK